MSRLLLLDTNLLLFFLVTQVNLDMLRTFKRVRGFSASDLQPLRDMVEAFSALITTPHVLTEVSNFVDQAPLPWRPQLIAALQKFAREQQERYERSADLVLRDEFKQLALADTALLSLSDKVSIATLDYELYGRIVARGGKAIHFDHVRGASGGRRRIAG